VYTAIQGSNTIIATGLRVDSRQAGRVLYARILLCGRDNRQRVVTVQHHRSSGWKWHRPAISYGTNVPGRHSINVPVLLAPLCLSPDRHMAAYLLYYRRSEPLTVAHRVLPFGGTTRPVTLPGRSVTGVATKG
jgi:hypothetical protein